MPTLDGLVLADTRTAVIVAMIIFIAVFLAIVGWVIFARQGRFKDAAHIPLEDDRVVTPRAPEASVPDDSHPTRESSDA
jgi:cbb3-type cytochrome oxidase subunit 3